MATRKRKANGQFVKSTKRKRLALPSSKRRSRKAKSYKEGARTSIAKGRSRAKRSNYCRICKGAHKPRHGLPPAKKLLAKGMSPRRAKVILKRRNAAKVRSGGHSAGRVIGTRKRVISAIANDMRAEGYSKKKIASFEREAKSKRPHRRRARKAA